MGEVKGVLGREQERKKGGGRRGGEVRRGGDTESGVKGLWRGKARERWGLLLLLLMPEHSAARLN